MRILETIMMLALLELNEARTGTRARIRISIAAGVGVEVHKFEL